MFMQINRVIFVLPGWGGGRQAGEIRFLTIVAIFGTPCFQKPRKKNGSYDLN